MGTSNGSDEFKRDAVHQLPVRGYLTHNAARHYVFEYIEMFDYPKRKHTNKGMLSPADFQTQQQKMKAAGV